MISREQVLLPRIRVLTWVFIPGLVLSGVTAIPLEREVDALVALTGAEEVRGLASTCALAWAVWLTELQDALREASARAPLLFYGTDWLAFGHFVIAIAFVERCAIRSATAGCSASA